MIKYFVLALVWCAACCPALFAQQKPVEILIKNGQAQPIPALSDPSTWIWEEVWVEAPFDSDGDGKLDRMHTMITRPAITDSSDLKLPVIYQSSPYYGLRLWALMNPFGKGKFWDVTHELGESPRMHGHTHHGTRTKRPLMASISERQWIPRGFVMVYSSSPGTGLSDGSPTIGGENESLAPKAVIEWLCGKGHAYASRSGTNEVYATWCNGRVGMTGTSYDGTLCIAAATTGVEGLKAIIPIAPVTSWYHYYRANGLVIGPDGYQGEDVDVIYDFINTGDKSKRKRNNAMVRDSILVKYQDRETGDYNDFWASRDYLPKVPQMKAAMLMAHGFNDWNVTPMHSIRFYEAAKAQGLPTQLYVHQADHGGEPPFATMNRWFTRYLFDVQNGVEQDLPVQIVREHAKQPTLYPSYPDAKAKPVKLYLKGGANNTGSLMWEPVSGPSADTLVDDRRLGVEELVQEKNAEHRLLFLSPVLQEDMRISGTPQVTIVMGSNKAAANLSVYLVQLPWNTEKKIPIYENIVNRSWADPQNHSSLTHGEPMKQGEYYTVTFDLMPDDQVIAKGKQLGLLIFSSDKNFTLLPKPGTELYIDLGASSLTLPVVGSEE